MDQYKYIVIILFFSSCTSSFNKENIYNVNIDNSTTLVNEQLQERIRDIEIVPLGNSEILIKNINNIKFYKDFIFILFGNKYKSLRIINSDGKMIASIDKIGRDRGNYMQVTDFTIDQNNKTLIVLDLFYKKIIEYNFNGLFLKEKKLNFAATKIMSSSDKFYFYTQKFHYKGVKDCEIIITNDEFSIRNELFEYVNEKPLRFETGNIFFKTNDGNLIISRVFRDTIYIIKNNTLKPFAILKIENEIPNKYTINKYLFREHANQYNYFYNNCFASNDFLSFLIFKKTRIVPFFFNIHNMEVFNAYRFQLSENIKLGYPIACDGKSFYFKLLNSTAMEYRNELKNIFFNINNFMNETLLNMAITSGNDILIRVNFYKYTNK